MQKYSTGFYGNPIATQHVHSWELLRRLGVNRSQPWIVLGDFNEVLLSTESRGRGTRLEFRTRSFWEVINDLNLSEIKSVGANFTWHNRRTDLTSTWVKLDWGFGNTAVLHA